MGPKFVRFEDIIETYEKNTDEMNNQLLQQAIEDKNVIYLFLSITLFEMNLNTYYGEKHLTYKDLINLYRHQYTTNERHLLLWHFNHDNISIILKKKYLYLFNQCESITYNTLYDKLKGITKYCLKLKELMLLCMKKEYFDINTTLMMLLRNDLNYLNQKNEKGYTIVEETIMKGDFKTGFIMLTLNDSIHKKSYIHKQLTIKEAFALEPDEPLWTVMEQFMLNNDHVKRFNLFLTTTLNMKSKLFNIYKNLLLTNEINHINHVILNYYITLSGVNLDHITELFFFNKLLNDARINLNYLTVAMEHIELAKKIKMLWLWLKYNLHSDISYYFIQFIKQLYTFNIMTLLFVN
jgi:hypothetical protein